MRSLLGQMQSIKLEMGYTIYRNEALDEFIGGLAGIILAQQAKLSEYKRPACRDDERTKQILDLHFTKGLSYGQIANLLGMTKEAIAKRIQRADPNPPETGVDIS